MDWGVLPLPSGGMCKISRVGRKKRADPFRPTLPRYFIIFVPAQHRADPTTVKTTPSNADDSADDSAAPKLPSFHTNHATASNTPNPMNIAPARAMSIPGAAIRQARKVRMWGTPYAPGGALNGGPPIREGIEGSKKKVVG